MSNKNFPIYQVLLVLMAAIFVSYVFYIKYKFSRTMNAMIQESSFITQNYSHMKNNFLIGIKSELINIDIDAEINSVQGDNEDFLSFVSSGKKIILYFPPSTCTNCYDIHIKEFIRMTENGNYHNFAILASVEIIRRTLADFKDYPNLNIFTRVSEIEELENVSVPCFFTVDKGFKVNNFFIPVQSDIDLTINYLEALLHRDLK